MSKKETINPTFESIIMLAVGSGRVELLDGCIKRLQEGESLSLPRPEQRFVMEALQNVIHLASIRAEKLNDLEEKFEVVMEAINNGSDSTLNLVHLALQEYEDRR